MTNDPVVVCFPFVGDFVGGSHVSALGLISNLDRSRFQPLVVLNYPEGPVAQLFRREGIIFETAPILHGLGLSGPRNFKALLNVARTVPALVKFLKARNVSIVHTNDGRTHVVWGFAARLAGVKHLWHHRGDATSFGLRYISPWLPSRLVAVSKFASPRPGLFSSAEKCIVVHSPFDVEKIGTIKRRIARRKVVAEILCAPDTKLIGFVGTLEERKRPIVFVEAIAALRQLAPDLNIAGLFLGNAVDGLDSAARTRADALGVSKQIHFMGFRYPGELWIAGLDVLLVTAVREPLGRTLVEAMLLGTPVIGANSGGNPEVVKHGRTGLLVRPDDAVEFAKACLGLFRDVTKQTAIVELARDEARARFGIQCHVNAITAIYENFISSGKR